MYPDEVTMPVTDNPVTQARAEASLKEAVQYAHQQAAANQCAAKGVAGAGSVAGKLSAAPGGPSAYRPLYHRLYADEQNLSSQLDRTFRARMILERHPEFEELIELLGLVRVPMRVKPVQADRALVIE